MTQDTPKITLNITKYDGSLRARLPAHYVRQEGPLHIVELHSGDPVVSVKPIHAEPTTRPLRYFSVHYIWEDRWYHVQRVARDGRTWYYADAGMPAVFDGRELSYVDLDLDVSWYPGEEPELLDEDEFLAHGALMRYPPEVIERARAAMDEVLELIRQRAFPFDGT